MKNRNSFFINIFLFFSTLLILLFAVGCDQSVKISNSPPSINSLETSACHIVKGGTVHLQATADDDDGDALSYSWKATGGSFSNKSDNGAQIDWTSPGQPGTFVITLSVTDQIDVANKSISIEVCEKFPTSMSKDTTIVYEGYDYILTNSSKFVVQAGLTLTLGPGVKVLVNSEFGGFDVYGTLIVNGTKESPVRISANACTPVEGLWEGIGFSGSPARGELRHLEVSFATNGIFFEKRSAGTLLDCAIFNNDGTGLVVTDQGSSVEIRGCKIWDNFKGVYVRNADLAASNSTIRYNASNGVEINVTDPSLVSVTIDSCVVANNEENGFLLTNSACPSIHRCSIFSNGLDTNGYAVKLSSYNGTEDIHAENNFWGLLENPETDIPATIYDKADDAAIGAFVVYEPWLTSPPVSLGLGLNGRVR